MRRGDLLKGLEDGSLLPRLEPVYGKDAENAAQRLLELMEEYAGTFPCGEDADTWLFSTPGRTELGGNHTDHQRGHCLAAAVELDTIACAVPNGSNIIRIKSRHHRMAEVDLNCLALQDAETGSSPALVRGVAARLAQLGYAAGGFDAYTTTRVLRGSGLSSSAAFEVMACTIMNHLFCGGRLSPIQLAQVGQYAENVYYGKPCGLLDQLSCACGGVIAAGFQDPAQPSVQQVHVDLAAQGYALCIVDAGASHASLIEDYASIPREMGQVAAHFGKEVLGEVPYEDFQREMSAVRAACGDRAVLRAIHFYQDDRRVAQQLEALEQRDLDAFLRLVRQSGRSSFMYLQNVSTYRDSRVQPMAVLLAQAEELLGDRGACRIHGGGFAGTIQAFVPLDLLEAFTRRMEALTRTGACYTLDIRSTGSVCLIA